MTQPTKDQVNQALAKFDGWKHVGIINDTDYWRHPTYKPECHAGLIDYTLDSSLSDLMRVATKLSEKHGWRIDTRTDFGDCPDEVAFPFTAWAVRGSIIIRHNEVSPAAAIARAVYEVLCFSDRDLL